MIDGKTQLLGLIGWPVSHSYSPAMHNAAAAALNLNLAYVPLPVPPDRLADALSGLVALGFRGINVTVPHKEAVLPYLNAVHPAARAIGAVNTIVIDNGLLTGFNTDWLGFLADLESYSPALYGRDCLVLGAGGSARAVAYALLSRGAHVTVTSRRLGQAEQLASELGAALPVASPIQIAHIEDAARVAAVREEPIIINTTPLGMAGGNVGRSPWPDGAKIPRGAFVYDLIYNPPRTLLMAQAEDAGCRAVNGLGMLVGQAAEAFELLTGQRSDPAVMRDAVGM